MTPLLYYLFKLSVSLSVVYLFYQFVLRRLTFYNWNRWYLVGYAMLSFLIPFIDVSAVLEKNEWANTSIVQWVPSFQQAIHTGSPNINAGRGFSAQQFVEGILVTGMMIMLCRLVVQLLSFRKMMRKAEMLPARGMKLYQVDHPIIPFSFGNSIFINRSLHDETELREIILHEFIHVKQKHSLDIIFSEILCLLNWYNPFAWLIRKAIRQNLEFIADNQVLQNGVDRKKYQYLLLKVIGNNHFSIAPKFNFSSLKKRIAMMNKMKSAGLHIVKFLFIVPLVAVMLLAFRNRYQHSKAEFSISVQPVSGFTDTVPSVKAPNSKGYYIDIKGVNGECTVIVKDKDGTEVEKVLLDDWKKSNRYEDEYGEILPPPPAIPSVAVAPTEPAKPSELTPPAPPVKPGLPANCCDDCPEVIYPAEVVAVGGHVYGLKKVASEWDITDEKAEIKLKNGAMETYDLTSPEDKAKFESRYGKLLKETGSGINAALSARTGAGGTYAIAPVAGYLNNFMQDYSATITGKEDVLIKITKNTTQADLDKFIAQMKEKDIELKFNNIDFNDGKLISLSGTMKSKSGTSNFNANDFEVLILAMIRKDDQTFFKVSVKNSKEVI